MLKDKVFGEDILHVSCIEECVVNTVDFTIDLGISYGLGDIFDTDDRGSITCYKVGNCTCTRIEVVDMLLTRQLCKFPSDLIQLVGLLAIRLVEGLRANAEGKPLHSLLDIVTTRVAVSLLVSDGVIGLCIDDIE